MENLLRACQRADNATAPEEQVITEFNNANLILEWCALIPDEVLAEHAIIQDVRAELKAEAIAVRKCAHRVMQHREHSLADLADVYDRLRRTALYYCELVKPEMVSALDSSL